MVINIKNAELLHLGGLRSSFFLITMTYLQYFLSLIVLFFALDTHAQVEMRDTTIVWQHHEFTLQDDYSMELWSTDDDAIQEVSFQNAKVIENELIRLVVVPEYGARVISFYYKPTGHEYLYQSPCGSPFGIGEGNFYYNWLMVWGGIFPTFPEPEHGKTWLIPWDLEIIENTSEVVTIKMSYTDDVSFANAPRSFNNGITGITCEVSVSVYRNSAAWDFDVNLINNQTETVNYEYWTCTTLTPGSEPDDTRSPLDSEMIIPADSYFAAWSPGGWIGDYEQYYSLEGISYLDDWPNMGIAYVDERNADHWGVINHENEQGIMRISDRETTPGMKLWTWGRNNIDNDMYDFSNGGTDNYIELWAGTSRSFFTDDILSANETKSWTETYVPTTNMIGLDVVDANAAINLIWNKDDGNIRYAINTYNTEDIWNVKLHIAELELILEETSLIFDAIGHTGLIDIQNLNLESGTYEVTLELSLPNGSYELSTSEEITIGGGGILDSNSLLQSDLVLRALDHANFEISMTDQTEFYFQLYNLNGQLIEYSDQPKNEVTLNLTGRGIYIVKAYTNQKSYLKKILLK